MKPLVSVIIPVYNSERYLKQCLDSIVNQTWYDLQIICVDDGSSDHSWKILNEYSEKDKRLLIIRKENEGVSKARNLALEHANGEYIAFVDSDDWIDLDTIECSVKAMKKYNADVVLWSYIREIGNISLKKEIFSQDIVFEESAVRDKLYRRMIGLYKEELSQPENMDAICPVWMKLYRRSIINDNKIQFYDIREIGTYEDGLFNLNYFSYAKKAVFIEKYFYHYRRDNAESVTTVYKPNLPEQWDKLFNLLNEHIENHKLNDTFRMALSNRIALSTLFLGLNVMECKESCINKMKIINKLISKPQYRKALQNLELAYFPFYWKVFFLLAKWKCTWGIFCLLVLIQKIRRR